MPDHVTIIISEDDKGHFILMKHRLKQAGIGNDIVWLCDGQQTLDFLYSDQFEPQADKRKRYIILLDIRMPKVDGIDVLEKVKHDEKLKAIPVIMVTSSDHPDNIHRCRALGCDGYIVKPLDENAIELIERISQMV
jgi:CheY-like chemotaxis protein